VGKAKVKDDKDPKGGKQKVSEVEESKENEGKGTSPRKVKSWRVIEDSDEEGDWLQDREARPKKDMDKVEVAKEVRESSVSKAEVQEKVVDKGKGKKEVRRLERTEMMKELILAVR
jgi:hypothetical protein